MYRFPCGILMLVGLSSCFSEKIYLKEPELFLWNFPGEYGCISLDPDNVRLAPIWNGEQKSWRVTVVELDLQVKRVSRNV
jgi:hypothetical protein